MTSTKRFSGTVAAFSLTRSITSTNRLCSGRREDSLHRRTYGPL
jgi:hypothetical protein